MSVSGILLALQRGPKTNAQLQEACGDHSGGISRTAAGLIKRGMIKRVDGDTGRGRAAIYALANWSGAVPTETVSAWQMKAPLLRHMTPEEDHLLRTMVSNRCSQNELVLEFRCAAETCKRWLTERGLKLNPRHKGRPRKQVEVRTFTTLESAVDRLRRYHNPVFAECTLKYPSRTPNRYGPATLFRVGGNRNVPASTVLEMAGRV